MPPSLDDLPGRTPPVPRPPGGTKRGKGKQKGAPGAALSPVENPGRRVPAYPKRVGVCQAGLDPLVHEAAGMLARQQIDVPLVTATVTEYPLHSLRCGCGHVTRAELPAGVADAPVSIGPNLQTLAVYLLVVHAIPVERTCQVIADLTGARVSPGFVHGMLARAAARVRARHAGPRRRPAGSIRDPHQDADHLVVCGAFRRDDAAGRGQGHEAVRVDSLHGPVHLLLPGRPQRSILQGVRDRPQPARLGDRARPPGPL